jgi:DNA-binding MurR/RpiR family transcriptional regulator
MNLENKIKYCTQLTPLEIQFSQYVLKNRKSIINSRIEDIVKNTYVSKSLIHRFCKKIGLNGFNELKVKIAQEIDTCNELQQIDVNFPFSEQDSQKNIAEKLLNLYENTVRDTHDSIDLNELWNIVLILYKAKYIDIYTHAHNSSIAENFQDKMLSIARFVSCQESSYKQRRQGLLSNKEHAALILSYSGKATFIPSIVKILHERNVPVIWIGRAGNIEMSRQSNYQLYISDRENFRSRLSQFSSHIAMQYTMDLLFSCIFKIDYKKNTEYLKNSINFIDDRNLGK